MIGFMRLMVFWAIFAAIMYWLLLTYARSTQREALEKKWDAEPPADATDTARTAFIDTGMATYETSLRRKLLWGVIVLPFFAISLLVYLINYA